MKFFAAIGKTDYIKINGCKKGVWEFLEHQPDGWLCSIAFNQAVIPHHSQILWDCGAYTYRHLDVPMLGKNLVTPHWAIHQYKKRSRSGDIIVAPDSLLLGNNLETRIRFNHQSAIKFIELSRKLDDRIIMAVVHGVSIEARIKVALDLYNFGYRAIGIGGLVATASNKQHNIKIIKIITKELRKLPEPVWIHVFGLSSPAYARVFNDINLTSFDGASHFKEAFTAGSFFLAEGERLIKYKAIKPNDKPTAPLCNCLCCQTLRQHGFETRSYGIWQNNLGRAIHNLNQLLIAQKYTTTQIKSTSKANFKQLSLTVSTYIDS